MGEQHDMAADLVAERAGATTDPVTHLPSGTVIRAEIDGSPDAVTIISELGEDYRNVVLLHINTDAEAAIIKSQDKLRFRLFGDTITVQVIKRRDNPAGPQTDFWCQELTAKDT